MPATQCLRPSDARVISRHEEISYSFNSGTTFSVEPASISTNKGPFGCRFNLAVLRCLPASTGSVKNLFASNFYLAQAEVDSRMNFTNFLKMLIELEHAIGVESETAIRIRIQDIEDAVLNSQKERVAMLRAEHKSFAA